MRFVLRQWLSLLRTYLIAANLPKDRHILDLAVLGEEERFAQNDRKGTVALERQKYSFCLRSLRAGTIRHDAKILIVLQHMDAAAAKMDLIRLQLTANDQESSLNRTFICDPEARQQPSKNVGTTLRNLRQFRSGVVIVI